MRLRNYYNFTFDATIFEIDLKLTLTTYYFKRKLLIIRFLP